MNTIYYVLLLFHFLLSAVAQYQQGPPGNINQGYPAMGQPQQTIQGGPQFVVGLQQSGQPLPNQLSQSGPPALVPGFGPPTQLDNTTATPNRVVESAQCLCNRDNTVCDIGCCCDPDCSAEDVNAFRRCSETEDIKSSRQCVDANQLAFFRLSSFVDFNEVSSKMLCIDLDKSEERNYVNHLETTDDPAFLKKVVRNHKNEVVLKDDPPLISPFDRYSVGDSVLVCQSSAPSNVFGKDMFSFGRLTLPSTGFVGTSCNDNRAITYMKNTKSVCWWRNENNKLSDDSLCNLPQFSPSSYYKGMFVIRNPRLFRSLNFSVNYTRDSNLYNAAVQLSDLSDIQAVAGSDNVTDAVMKKLAVPVEGVCSDGSATVACKQPLLNDQVCMNVAVGVFYNAYFEDGWITSAKVTVVMKDMSVDDLRSFPATFSTTFQRQSTSAFQPGKPDYVVKRPIATGIAVLQQSDPIHVTSKIALLNSGLSIADLPAPGDTKCSSANRRPVLFGVDFTSACTIPLTGSCYDIQQTVYNLAFGEPNNRPTHIAMFGDSDPLIINQWVPILNDSVRSALVPFPSSSKPGTCQNLRTSVTLRIIHVNVGSLRQPKIQIVGAAYDFGAPRDYNFPCFGAAQCPNPSIFVSFSVRFEDYTKMSTSTSALSNDHSYITTEFFYPFFMNAPKSGASRPPVAVKIVLLLYVCLLCTSTFVVLES